MNVRHLVGADLNLLLVFEAIWRERSITRAAEFLRVTQPAVSHALRRLRVLADDPLFVKGGAGVVPTPRAESVSSDVSAALGHALAALRPEQDFDPRTVKATVRLGLSDYATWVVLPSLIDRLRAEAPGVRLVGVPIDNRRPYDGLERGSLDLVFGPRPSGSGRLHSEPILSEPLVCLVDKSGGFASTLDLDAYVAQPHLVVAYDGDPRSWTDRELEARGLTRDIGLVLPYGMALADTLRGSGMIMTVAKSVADRMAQDGDLAVFPHPLGERCLELHQIWHERLHADPLAAWLRTTVRVDHNAN